MKFVVLLTAYIHTEQAVNFAQQRQESNLRFWVTWNTPNGQHHTH